MTFAPSSSSELLGKVSASPLIVDIVGTACPDAAAPPSLLPTPMPCHPQILARTWSRRSRARTQSMCLTGPDVGRSGVQPDELSADLAVKHPVAPKRGRRHP